MNNLTFGGWDPSRGRSFAYYETIAGGAGASARGNGRDAVHTHMTNSLNTPVEAFEHQFPVRIRSYRVRAGSGGRGRFQGGNGVVKEFEFLTAAEVTVLSDRRQIPPYGLAGGKPARQGENYLERSARQGKLAAKVRLEAAAGDVLRVETPGGGGWGG
jgi:N-methylhydantoinase B